MASDMITQASQARWSFFNITQFTISHFQVNKLNEKGETVTILDVYIYKQDSRVIKY